MQKLLSIKLKTILCCRNDFNILSGAIMTSIRSLFCLAIASLAISSPLSSSTAHPIDSFPSATLVDQPEQMLKQLNYLEMFLQEFFISGDIQKLSHTSLLDALFQEAKKTLIIQPPSSVKEFRQRLNRLLNSLTDWHTSLSFYSSEASLLPFTMREAQGRYFVFSTSPTLFQQLELTAMQVGDEILEWNGRPVSQAVAAFCQAEFPLEKPAYAWRHAASFLTARFGQYGQLLPDESSVQLKVRKRGSQSLYTITIPWLKLEEEIQPRSLPEDSQIAISPLKRNLQNSRYLESPYAARLEQQACSTKKISKKIKERLASVTEEEDDEYNYWYSYAAKHPLPPLGSLLWESKPEHLFFARLTKHPSGKKVAYVRLPSFNQPYSEDYEDHAIQFANLMRTFERTSDLLVIDQRMNGGGALLYLYSLIQPLLTQPIAPPLFIERLSHEEIAKALDMSDLLSMENDRNTNDFMQEGETVNGYPFDKKFVAQALDYYRFLIDAWNSGVILTKPHAYLGIDSLTPHPTKRYTKPIILLIDESALSCGDIFPALMQDSGRATLVGTNTAGAGGHVARTCFPNPWGISSCSYAASLILRPNGNLIDRIGVAPDLVYETTADDLEYDYRDYQHFLNQLIDKM